MEKQIDLITQYGKLSSLYLMVNFVHDEIKKEEKILEEMKKESEKK